MNTIFGKSFFAGILFVTAAAISLVPTVSIAQTGNTGTGSGSLDSNTTGSNNTADGYFALTHNTTAAGNTAIGYLSLFDNTVGYENSANGAFALFGNTTGYQNTANGYGALYINTTGYANTAIGNETLYKNILGTDNTANGFEALYNNNGSFNTAFGYEALSSNTAGHSNIAVGHLALGGNTTGSNNLALGFGSGLSLKSGSNNIEIGNAGNVADSGVIRIGTSGVQTYVNIAGITNVSAGGLSAPVYITPSGFLGIMTSSRRFKFDIQNIGVKSDKLMDLRPVSFRYKEAAEDGAYPVQYGLIAEEVAKVYPDLVQYDKHGKPFTVYYHLLTPMMLDQLQKAHHRLDTQDAEISSLKSSTQTAIQTQSGQVASLRHTNQLQFVLCSAMFMVFVLYVISGRARRRPSVDSRQIVQSSPLLTTSV